MFAVAPYPTSFRACTSTAYVLFLTKCFTRSRELVTAVWWATSLWVVPSMTFILYSSIWMLFISWTDEFQLISSEKVLGTTFILGGPGGSEKPKNMINFRFHFSSRSAFFSQIYAVQLEIEFAVSELPRVTNMYFLQTISVHHYSVTSRTGLLGRRLSNHNGFWKQNILKFFFCKRTNDIHSVFKFSTVA